MKVHKKPSLIILGALVVVAVAAYLAVHHLHKTGNLEPATGNTTSTAPTTPADKTSTGSPTVTADPNVPGGSTGSSTTPSSGPTTPTGTFISNHSTDLDSGNSRNQEQSVCNTTVGATCEITFTNGGITKSLGVQSVVAASKDETTGTASWPVWTPAGIGLTQGTWQVNVTATLNGQTAKATDQLTVN